MSKEATVERRHRLVVADLMCKRYGAAGAVTWDWAETGEWHGGTESGELVTQLAEAIAKAEAVGATKVAERANDAIRFINEEGWAHDRYAQLKAQVGADGREWLTVQECLTFAELLGWAAPREPTVNPYRPEQAKGDSK